jgi:hypothetical protein
LGPRLGYDLSCHGDMGNIILEQGFINFWASKQLITNYL